MAREISKDSKTVDTAENKAEVVQEQEPKKEQKTAQEAVYSLSEFAANAGEIFGTRQECVAAALKAAGKTECTIIEAKEIVEKFLKREVK